MYSRNDQYCTRLVQREARCSDERHHELILVSGQVQVNETAVSLRGAYSLPVARGHMLHACIPVFARGES